MSNPQVLIVGYGIVGKNLHRELAVLNPHIYDKYQSIDSRGLDHYDIAFICVDTPTTIDTTCDISEVICAINENTADVFVIKSTILPEQAKLLTLLSTQKHIVVSPEYFGNTQHCNNYEFNFTILGGERSDCIKVIQALQEVYDASHLFKITDIRTAALVKYMENSYLAMKVSFCTQFFEIAEKAGVSYEELRELFILDPRVNPSHTFVYREHPYWDSHCLNKDVNAIAQEYDAELLRDIVRFNVTQRGIYKLVDAIEAHAAKREVEIKDEE